jgi:RNA polymerase sigma factor (sigma-70 family)
MRGANQDRRPIHELVEQQREFLRFLRMRVGQEDLARELLQAAYLRGLEKTGELRRRESADAWFYRMLRNAIADLHRGKDAERRALTRYANEPAEAEDGLRHRACQCVHGVLPKLKPEYAAVLKSLDLEGVSIGEFARSLGLEPNNVGVRLHRARRAARREILSVCGTCAEHGCLDCDCRASTVSRPGEDHG